jgi:hypothetical protein
MTRRNWENWAAATLGRRSLVEPSEFVLQRAIAVGKAPLRRTLPGWLAAAAVLTLAVTGTILFTKTERPGLPPRAVESTVRSGELTALAPSGRMDAMPDRLTWETDARAARYVARIYAVDDTVLFEGTATGGALDLPQEFTASLHAAVSYTWSVEAYDSAGALVARSQRTRFQVRP